MSPLRLIQVVAYDPAWAEAFVQEAACIAAVLADNLLSIHHIGSTSVPGLQAKPIIDIMLVVKELTRLDNLQAEMEAIGYVARGENGIPGRRYFRKGGNIHRTHHIHAYEPGHPEVARHLAFREYLRAHPDSAEQYGRLKAELAEQFPHDIYGYMAGKDALIKDLIRKAQE